MKKTRKKGSIILLSLAMMIAIVVFAAVFLNIAASYDTVNRIMYATEEGARMRAQAVDIRLKEQEGMVEVFHYNYSDDYIDFDVKHDDIEPADGHKLLYKPGDDIYDDKVALADQAAKKAAINVLKSSLRKNVDGTPLIDPKEENFCIDIKPIPDNENIIDFECNATLNGEDYNFTYTIYLSDAQKFQYKKLKVKNAVFFASVIGYEHFIHNGLRTLGLSINPHFKHWEISFPQVDVCTRAADPLCDSNIKGYDLN